jgi:hypothetical protein
VAGAGSTGSTVVVVVVAAPSVVAGAAGSTVSVVVASVVPVSLQAATEKRARAETEARTIFFMASLLSAKNARFFFGERLARK